MKNTKKLIMLSGLTLVLTSNLSVADESLWVYTKGTDTRPQGTYEVKVSDIYRYDKNSGSYKFHDIRPELEYGVTDRLTVTAELMIFKHNYSIKDPELNPMYENQEDKGSYSKTQFAGYEFGLKYNLLSPYKDAFGLSVGLNYERRDQYRLDGADIDQDSFVVYFLAQKNFLDDKLVVAANFKTEFERRKSGDSTERVLEEEIALDISAGISYRIQPRWFVGFELRRQSDYLSPVVNGEPDDPSLKASNFDLTRWRIGSMHQYGFYAGPTVHYAQKKWWLTAGVLWQVKGGGSPHAYVEDGKNWDEHEKAHVGLTYAYNF